MLGAQNARASCDTSIGVATTLQAAVNSIPATLTGDFCIIVPQSSYGEQVEIRNKDTAGFRIYITSAPGTLPIIDPPAGSTAAFVVDNDDVTLIGFQLSATNNPTWSVLGSSQNAVFTSLAADRGVVVSTTALLTSVTAPALVVDGNNAVIDFSSFTSVSIHGDAAEFTSVELGTVNASGASPFFDGSVIRAGYFTGYGPAFQAVSASTIAVYADDSNMNGVTVSSLTVSGDGLVLMTVDAATLTVTGAFPFLSGVTGGTLTVSGLTPRLENLGLAGGLFVSGAGAVVQDSMLRSVVLGPNSDQGLIVRSTATRITLLQSQQPTLAYSYVAGSTAVFVTGSTGAVVHSNRIHVTAFDAAGVSAGANAGLSVTSNTIVGGTGVHLGGNDGVLEVSTNTLRASRNGIKVQAQAASADLRITSNTINAALVFAGNSYGIHIDGVSSLVTVRNNDLYHDAPSSLGGGTANLIYARGASALTVRENRLNSPGMVTVGNLVGIYLESSANAQVIRNDGYLAASSLTNGFMVQLVGSAGASMFDNVFVTGVSGASTGTISLDTPSLPGFTSNFNDYWAVTGRPSNLRSGGRVHFPAAWRALTGQDFDSIGADPDWPSTAGAGDFHPRSQAGRWDPALASFVFDTVTSPTIGRGQSGNMGSYAGTPEASLPFLDLPPGCPDGFNVKADASLDFATIQEAVDSFRRSPAVDTCAVVRDTATYAGALSFDGFTQAADVRLKVMSDPSFISSAPVVGSLAVRSSSVTVDRLIVRPTSAVGTAVLASSMSVVLTTITVDGGSLVTQVGMHVSSMAFVRYSSVAVANATGLLVDGLGIEVSDTWVKANLPLSGLRLNGGLASNGPLTVLGHFDLHAGVWSAGPHQHTLGGDLIIGAAGSFSHQGSTLAFALGPGAHQRIITPFAGMSFGHLLFSVTSVTFNRGFAAVALTHEVAGGTVTFANGQTYDFGAITVRGGPPPAGRITLRSDLDAAPWLLGFGRSTFTAVAARDSTVSGSTAHANDGTSVGGANLTGWNFKPFLAALAPGESWVDGTGKTGASLPQTVGTPFDVTVLAYDSSSRTATFPTFAAPVVWNEVFVATPAAQPLEAGATVYSNVAPRTAQSFVLSPQSTSAFLVWGTTVPVSPGAPTRMQILLSGEDPLPGSPTGKTGVPEIAAQFQRLQVQVRQTDLFWNLVSSVDQVLLTTAAPHASNLPQTATLIAGATVFDNVFFTSTGSVQLLAQDLTGPFALSDTSSVLTIFTAQVASPTIVIAIPSGSIRATLGGGVNGTAADGIAVSRVSVAVQRRSDGVWYDWASGAFAPAGPVFGLAALTPNLAKLTSWVIALPDDDLTGGTSYYVVARATNPSSNLTVAESTFSYTLAGLAPGSGADGAGTLSALPASGPGCDVGVTTLTYTAGPAGLAAGGVVAVRLPDGWTVPRATTAANPPLSPGEVRVQPADAWVEFSPAGLGDGWIAVSTPLAPGASVILNVRSFQPSRPFSQSFPVLSRGASSGQLLPLASLPSAALTAGTTFTLSFEPSTPLTLGALQLSPTMQLVITDLCGTERVTPSAVNASLDADPAAVFFTTGSLAMPGRLVTFPAGASRSSGFFFRSPVSSITLSANGFALGTAKRDVRFLASALSLTGVSIDTGTLIPGALSATMTANPFLYPAYVNFDAPDEAPWEVVFATAPGGTRALARRSGSGPPGRSVSWNALDEGFSPPRAVAPGDYWAQISLGGGASTSAAASVHVDTAAVPFIFGSLGAAGASADVTASGPGAGAGLFASAGSAGGFVLYGLQPGAVYEVRATSGSVIWTATATAVLGGVDLGLLPLPANGTLRLSASLPLPAPGELWGRALARDSSFSRSALLTLHYTSGSSVSDDGAQGFGAAASTWSAVSLAPGTYSLEIEVAEARLSTTVTGLVVPAGGRLDVRLDLARKSRASGRVLLPAAPAAPVPVSLRAGRVQTTFFAGSAANEFSVFGLDPGTNTVSASAPGYRPASLEVFVSTSAEDAPNLDLALSTHGVITGTVTVSGSTLGLGTSFYLDVDAYQPAGGGRARSTLLIPSNFSQASATFSFTGLADGLWSLSAALPGFVPALSTAAAGGAARLDLAPEDAWSFLTVRLPGGPHAASEFRKVSLARRSPDGGVHLRQDLVGSATVQYMPSSATVRLGGLPTGRVSFTALYSVTGASARGSSLFVQGSTTPLVLDLSASTYTLRGTVGVNGTVVYSSAGFSVAVSSAGGLLAKSATAYHCILGSTAPARAPGFHVELVPLEEGESFSRPLHRSTACPSVLHDGEAPLAYLAPVNVDGSFELRGVPSGFYALRSGGDLDGDPRNGLELPVASRDVRIEGADLSSVTLRLDRGRAVSGRVTGAPGRSFIVALLGSDGAAVRAGVAAPDWILPGVPPGEYTLKVEDVGSPKAYAARPRALTVDGGDLSGLELAVEPAGQIQGRLVLEAPASSAAAVMAVASPWFHGGSYPGAVSGDRFVVDGLPAGVYEVRALPADGRFSSGSQPGIAVARGRVTEAGALLVPLSRQVAGRVLGGGQPAAGVTVEAVPSFRTPGGPAAVRVLTGPDGGYLLTGLDPRVRFYDVTAAAKDEHDAFGAAAPWRPLTAPAVDVTSAAPVDFALDAALWSIRGRVAPVAARLSLKRTGEQRTVEAFTRHDGSFELPGLATGTYRLTASAEGYASSARLVAVAAGSVDVGTMTLTRGAILSGRLQKADGSSPSPDEVRGVAAAAPDLSEILAGTLSADNSAYEISGFRPDRPYRVLLIGRTGEVRAAADVRFSTTTESRRLDLLYRAPRPAALAKSRRSGAGFELVFDLTQPLRARSASDDDLAVILTTFSGTGLLSRRALLDGRTRLTAYYEPGVGESSFTIRLAGYTTELDPDSADPLNREHLLVSTAAFFTGVDGQHRSEISNLSGGAVGVEGDAGRVTLPSGAFAVDASSSVEVTLQIARALTAPAAAYPAGLLKAMAATPPSVSAFSSFYDVLLPLGVRTTLSRPAPLTVAYSTGADPAGLNLYWYNPAANAYVLQPDVTGSPPVIDRVNRTITVNVDHFSTFVLFQANVNVIGGAVFGGDELEVYNFPNPFDLKPKTVTTIHGGGTPLVRGTMIRVSVPAAQTGGGRINIYNVAGQRVRSLDLGQLAGGQTYYQGWDGRNDSGRDVASGVYIGVLSVGKKSKSFKMAVIK